MSAKVSIIIPVYNAATSLERCLDSIYAQTTSDWEIIAVNDGSNDASLDILRAHTKRCLNLIIIDQENRGQGYARNQAIKKARGEFVIFIDSDDTLVPNALELALASATTTDADIVHFGWKANADSLLKSHKASRYLPSSWAGKELYEGNECDEFIRNPNYFCMNNLFRHRFLLDKNIRFGEGYIYEDNEFMVAAANRASKIAILNEPLYQFNFNSASSSNSGFKTDQHVRQFLFAVQKCFDLLQPRLAASRGYLANYFLEKFTIYYQQRVPTRYKKEFRRGFVDLMAGQNLDAHDLPRASKFLINCTKREIFTKRRYHLFYLLILYKTQVAPRLNRH